MADRVTSELRKMYVNYYKRTNAHLGAFPKEANKSIHYNADI